MRVAALDCGTNSIRLLIADTARDGALIDVVRQLRVVRLGEAVDRTGRLAPAALERTRVAVADFAATIRSHDVDAVRMVATSATRDAQNRAEFVAMVRVELGVDPEVISGQEEAALSFAGAAGALGSGVGPMLVADIGGGSTELVHGGAGALRTHSMDIGCVRLTERHLSTDPPSDDPPDEAQVQALIADVDRALDIAGRDVAFDAGVPLVGVAGTVTTVAAIALGLAAYDPAAIHGARITTAQVEDVVRELLRMGRDERAALPVVHPGRVDVIVGGALILRTLLRRLHLTSLVASEHDILDGIALALAT